MAFSPASPSTLATTDEDGAVQLWTVAVRSSSSTLELEPLRTLRRAVRFTRRQKGSKVVDIAFSPNGLLLASALRLRDKVLLWSTTSGHLLREFAVQMLSCRLSFSASSKQLALLSFHSPRAEMPFIFTVCEWSDRNHHLFGQEAKSLIFLLMCCRKRLLDNHTLFLPMEMWLHVFLCLFP